MTQSILGLIAQHGVPLVGLLIIWGELSLPTGVPVELALLLVGSYAIHTWGGLALALLAVSAADVIGTTTLYTIARTGGGRLAGRFGRDGAQRNDAPLAAWRRRLRRHDSLVVFVIRLLPLIRMYAAIGTGLMRFPARSYLQGAVPAALVWTGTPLTLGFLYRTHVHQFATQYAAASHLFLFLLPVIVLSIAAAHLVRRFRRAGGSASDSRGV